MSNFEDNTNDGGHQYRGSSSGGNDIAGGDARSNDNAEEAGLRTRTSCPFPFGYFDRLRLETNDATGWLYFTIGSSTGVMSNVFLSTALILLAKREIGCEDVEVECGKVYGFKPSSLIGLIGTATGLLSAFFLPYFGAIIDYTHHRRRIGMLACALFIVIQAVQIGTVQQTWFIMAILQAVNGVLYQVYDLMQFAYLPEISDQVTESKTFTWYSSLTSILGFSHQVMFLLIVVGIGMALDLDDQRIGQLGQGIDVFVTGGYFYIAWIFYTPKQARRPLENGTSLAAAGFKQNWRTAKGIFREYPRTVGLYFLGSVFANSGVEAFVTVSITFLNEHLEFDATEVGILYCVVLLAVLPGAYFAFWLAEKLNPLTAIQVQLIAFIGVNFGSFLWLTGPSRKIEAHICGVGQGFCLGLFYPLSKTIYAMIIPRGQEAEMAGFYKYCCQVLSWAPPLVFTIMNESGIDLSWSGISVNIFLALGLVCFMRTKSWDECLGDAKVNTMSNKTGLNVDKIIRSDKV